MKEVDALSHRIDALTRRMANPPMLLHDDDIECRELVGDSEHFVSGARFSDLGVLPFGPFGAMSIFWRVSRLATAVDTGFIAGWTSKRVGKKYSVTVNDIHRVQAARSRPDQSMATVECSLEVLKHIIEVFSVMTYDYVFPETVNGVIFEITERNVMTAMFRGLCPTRDNLRKLSLVDDTVVNDTITRTIERLKPKLSQIGMTIGNDMRLCPAVQGVNFAEMVQAARLAEIRKRICW